MSLIPLATFTADSADGDIPDANHSFVAPPNSASIYIRGTWGGGTVTLVATADGINWHPTTVTLAAHGVMVLPTDMNALRWGLNLQGATAPNLIAAVY